MVGSISPETWCILAMAAQAVRIVAGAALVAWRSCRYSATSAAVAGSSGRRCSETVQRCHAFRGC